MNPNIISRAIEAHANTNHLYDGKPYSTHLIMAASFGYKYIHYFPKEDHNTIIHAIFCHDLIEDTRLTYNDVKEFAGEQVADIVYALTNNKGKNTSERANEDYYLNITQTKYATFVKLCDRLANVSYSRMKHLELIDSCKVLNMEINNIFATSSLYVANAIENGMLLKYGKENEKFTKALFSGSFDVEPYKEMTQELEGLFAII